MLGRNEPLARHIKERRQHNLVDHSASANLAVDHVQAPVKHCFGGNLRPPGSDPRHGRIAAPDELLEASPGIEPGCKDLQSSA